MNKVAKQKMLAEGKPIPKPKRVRRKVAAKPLDAPTIEAQAAVASTPVSAAFDTLNTGQKLEYLVNIALADLHRTLSTPIAPDARNYAKLLDAKERAIKTLLLMQARVAPDKLKEPGKDKMGELLEAIRQADEEVPAPIANGHDEAPADFDPSF